MIFDSHCHLHVLFMLPQLVIGVDPKSYKDNSIKN